MSDNQSRLGSYIRGSITAGETYQAFLPPALPPEPPLDLLALQGLLSKANQALGKLDAGTKGSLHALSTNAGMQMRGKRGLAEARNQ